MEVITLLGIERRTYVDKSTGELKSFVALHCMTETETENVTGNAVQSFSCPKDVIPDSLVLGSSYELVYTHFRTKNGMGARISDLVPIKPKS